MEAAEIADICKGIGMAKAATLSAAFELGARALRETLAGNPSRRRKTSMTTW